VIGPSIPGAEGKGSLPADSGSGSGSHCSFRLAKMLPTLMSSLSFLTVKRPNKLGAADSATAWGWCRVMKARPYFKNLLNGWVHTILILSHFSVHSGLDNCSCWKIRTLLHCSSFLASIGVMNDDMTNKTCNKKKLM